MALFRNDEVVCDKTYVHHPAPTHPRAISGDPAQVYFGYYPVLVFCS